jgi:hypothetical protein
MVKDWECMALRYQILEEKISAFRSVETNIESSSWTWRGRRDDALSREVYYTCPSGILSIPLIRPKWAFVENLADVNITSPPVAQLSNAGPDVNSGPIVIAMTCVAARMSSCTKGEFGPGPSILAKLPAFEQRPPYISNRAP